jgi:hypothetical protein
MNSAHTPLDSESQTLAESISADVLRVLNKHQFFARLEAQVMPSEPDMSSLCDHTYRFTDAVLLADGFDRDDREDIKAVLKANGGFCDCEILYNVDDREDSPKARYWRRQVGITGVSNS